ncbi:OmpH family outer membrane protein [Microscilla marina]|uniref:OmpH family outer membrane protein n=1 Tax=Microscilla marina ATCC 23134 TaxID=313606 RepID=A1ZP36_MICM2|nr:OmpH family outer membrane protein [Microscilla marina]EAY27828.1 conserved hypothetical protein [Microscilla marina ATCC 23134]
MKKTTYILLLILLVSFTSNVLAQTSPKVRFIDLQYVAQQLPAFKKAQKDLSALRKQLESELLKKQGELKKKFGAYEKEAPTMSDLIRASREQELKRLQDELVKFDRTARQQTMVKEQQLLSPIYKSISKNVETYSAEKQIDFVLRKDQLVYDTKAFNISDDILRKMGITPKKITPKGSNNKK